ncbi:MAG: hypothetical protein QW193_05820 [Nitrososphaerales archaeon]
MNKPREIAVLLCTLGMLVLGLLIPFVVKQFFATIRLQLAYQAAFYLAGLVLPLVIFTAINDGSDFVRFSGLKLKLLRFGYYVCTSATYILITIFMYILLEILVASISYHVASSDLTFITVLWYVIFALTVVALIYKKLGFYDGDRHLGFASFTTGFSVVFLAFYAVLNDVVKPMIPIFFPNGLIVMLLILTASLLILYKIRRILKAKGKDYWLAYFGGFILSSSLFVATLLSELAMIQA